MQRATVSTKGTPASANAMSWSLLQNRGAGLLQRKCACGGTPGPTGERKQCSKKKRLGLQTKLKVNEPGDIYEQEADKIADQVMATTVQPAVSRARPYIQRFSGQPNGQMNAAPASVDRVLASPGRPLGPALRQDMEQRFGHDFSKVQVHVDPSAQLSAREVNAKAYTMGPNIVFGANRLAPGSPEGRRLLAHELTHVVHQRDAPTLSRRIQRQPAHQKPTTGPTYRDCTVETTGTSNPDRELERARAFASDLVDTAIGALAKNDASELYRTALARHYIAPKFDDRKNIIKAYRLIKGYLKPEKFRCAASKDDVAECQTNPEVGITEAFTNPLQDTVICGSFWNAKVPCRGIFLIHEAAHGIGIGNDATHPPYRGSASYPHLAAAPPVSVTTEARKNNPDAYAYFAAHIGRETDTQCFGVPMLKPETIEIKGTAPKSEKKQQVMRSPYSDSSFAFTRSECLCNA